MERTALEWIPQPRECVDRIMYIKLFISSFILEKLGKTDLFFKSGAYGSLLESMTKQVLR